MKFQTSVLTILLGIALMVFPLALYGISAGDSLGHTIFACISVLGLLIVFVGFIGGMIGAWIQKRKSKKDDERQSQ